jgi:hypothetical protein
VAFRHEASAQKERRPRWDLGVRRTTIGTGTMRGAMTNASRNDRRYAAMIRIMMKPDISLMFLDVVLRRRDGNATCGRNCPALAA